MAIRHHFIIQYYFMFGKIMIISVHTETRAANNTQPDLNFYFLRIATCRLDILAYYGILVCYMNSTMGGEGFGGVLYEHHLLILNLTLTLTITGYSKLPIGVNLTCPCYTRSSSIFPKALTDKQRRELMNTWTRSRCLNHS